jgi:hypothetical protein
MSFAEVKEAVAQLSEEECSELIEQLQAQQEGVSIEEFRAIKAALDEALNDPSPSLSLKEVRAELDAWSRARAPQA